LKKKNKKKKGVPPGALRAILGVLALGLAAGHYAAVAGPAVRPGPSPGCAEFRFFYVGQGDCALITEGGCSILVDAGPDRSEDTVRSCLDPLAGGGLTACFFTHSDEDHIGGADMVLTRYGAGAVYMPGRRDDNPSMRLLSAAAAARGTDITGVSGGDVIIIGGLEVTVLAPLSLGEYDANEESLVLRIRHGAVTAVLAADAGLTSEHLMIRYWETSDLKCDLLKVAHHGSASSTGREFVELLSPAYAVISCGKNNSFGHPHATVTARLEAAGSSVFRTDVDGDLLFVSDGRTLTPPD
jgi:competence protein ComEC